MSRWPLYTRPSQLGLGGDSAREIWRENFNWKKWIPVLNPLDFQACQRNWIGCWGTKWIFFFSSPQLHLQMCLAWSFVFGDKLWKKACNLKCGLFAAKVKLWPKSMLGVTIGHSKSILSTIWKWQRHLNIQKRQNTTEYLKQPYWDHCYSFTCLEMNERWWWSNQTLCWMSCQLNRAPIER